MRDAYIWQGAALKTLGIAQAVMRHWPTSKSKPQAKLNLKLLVGDRRKRKVEAFVERIALQSAPGCRLSPSDREVGRTTRWQRCGRSSNIGSRCLEWRNPRERSYQLLQAAGRWRSSSRAAWRQRRQESEELYWPCARTLTCANWLLLLPTSKRRAVLHLKKRHPDPVCQDRTTKRAKKTRERRWSWSRSFFYMTWTEGARSERKRERA